MFWKTPKLPVSHDEQEWVEAGLTWLLGEFGHDYFLKKKTILPNQTFFPDKYRGTEQCVRSLVDRVCGYMDVAPDSVAVSVFESENQADLADLRAGESRFQGAAGLYHGALSPGDKMVVRIEIGQLKQPTSLVATIAHELGHVILLGGGRISAEDNAHEPLTDLLTVFLGMGIFTANSAFQFTQWQDHSHQGWHASRMGYLSESMFGYALATYCWMRNEADPGWTDDLAMNVRHYFRTSLRFLERGGRTSLQKLR